MINITSPNVCNKILRAPIMSTRNQTRQPLDDDFVLFDSDDNIENNVNSIIYSENEEDFSDEEDEFILNRFISTSSVTRNLNNFISTNSNSTVSTLSNHVLSINKLKNKIICNNSYWRTKIESLQSNNIGNDNNTAYYQNIIFGNDDIINNSEYYVFR